MSTPSKPDLTDPKGRTAEERNAKIDELLERIEAENRLSDSNWPIMNETLAQLSGLGDELSWFVVAYLSSVILHGDRMFRHSHTQQQFEFEQATRPTITCRCGQQGVEVPIPQLRNKRLSSVARCPTCGIDLVVFDEALYERPTLISSTFTF